MNFAKPSKTHTARATCSSSPSQPSAAIHKLANETLSSIFSFLADEARFDVSYLKRNDLIFGTTHTCQRWRNVAFGIPLLWTHLKYFTSSDLIQTFLERCKGLRVTVSLRVPQNKDSAKPHTKGFLTPKGKKLNLQFGFVLERCDTLIEKLYVVDELNSGETWSAVRKLIQKSLSHLQVLYLGPLSSVLGGPERMIVPFPTFSGNVPSLKKLSLTYIVLKWSELFIEPIGLTSLYLKLYDKQPTNLELLTILEKCSELQDLSLIGINRRPDPNDAPLDKIVSLPRLQKLRLAEFDYNGCAELLSHLQIKQNIVWEIDCEGYPADLESPGMSQWILEHIERNLQIKIFLTYNALEIEGYEMKNGTMAKASHLALTEFEESLDLHSVIDLFKTIVHNSAWINTQEVILNLEMQEDEFEGYFFQDSWSSLFKAIPNTVSLTILYPKESELDWPADSEFVSALQLPPHDSEDGDNEESPSFSLPLLRNLALKHFNFTENEEGEKNFSENLVQALQARDEADLHLETLVLDNCRDVRDEDVESISKCVKSIKYQV